MKIKALGFAIAVGGAAAAFAPTASAGSDPFIGEIAIYPYNFCPRGWAAADGQILPIAQNTALFSLYGTMYGGDGRTTFALPDLRGRVPMHPGQGPGLSDRRIGQKFGTETNTLTQQNLPAHVHGVSTMTSSIRSSGNPDRGSNGSQGGDINTVAGPADAADGAVKTSSTGSGQPINNMPPVTVIQYCVSLTGIFPSRN